MSMNFERSLVKAVPEATGEGPRRKARRDREFDAVHAWKPRDRAIIIERMEDYLARRRENVLVEVEDKETYL